MLQRAGKSSALAIILLVPSRLMAAHIVRMKMQMNIFDTTLTNHLNLQVGEAMCMGSWETVQLLVKVYPHLCLAVKRGLRFLLDQIIYHIYLFQHYILASLFSSNEPHRDHMDKFVK